MSKLKTLFYRGGIIESSHEIKCYVGSIIGENIFSSNINTKLPACIINTANFNYIILNYTQIKPGQCVQNSYQ